MIRLDVRLVPCALLLLAACGDRRSPRPAARAAELAEAVAEPEMLTYHPDLGVALDLMRRLPSGVLIQDLVEGAGDTVRTGQRARVRYTGWLHDGTAIDSNVGEEPFTFRVGAGDVIEGWDAGVPGMRVGGKRKLIIPPALAYGPAGSGPIPPFATLVFDVDLLAVLP
jgi:FKBP-type peptidyl-prolyl cis-trans isomerase FkpA